MTIICRIYVGSDYAIMNFERKARGMSIVRPPERAPVVCRLLFVIFPAAAGRFRLWNIFGARRACRHKRQGEIWITENLRLLPGAQS